MVVMMVDVGVIVDVGRVDGEFVGADPAGRYVAMLHQETVTVYDVYDTLASVACWRMDYPVFDQVAVHPNGRVVVVLNECDWALELWRAREGTPIRASTDIAGSQAARRREGQDWDRPTAGWLRYSADGSYLYFGEAVRGGPARLNLLDPATLVRLDSISPVGVHVGDESIEDWGEDLLSCCAPAPSTAVAFTTNAGDDILTLGVAKAAEGGLRFYSGRSTQSWVDVPGERGMAVVLLADDELIMLDSDQMVTAIRWTGRSAAARRFSPRTLAYGGDLLSSGEDTDRESAVQLRALVDDDADERLVLVGPMFAHGRLLAIAVERERWANGRLWQQIVGLVFVDVQSGERAGFLELPITEHIDLFNGTTCLRTGARTRVSRWVPPA